MDNVVHIDTVKNQTALNTESSNTDRGKRLLQRYWKLDERGRNSLDKALEGIEKQIEKYGREGF